MTGWILVILVFMVGILAWTSAVKQALLVTSDGALERRLAELGRLERSRWVIGRQRALASYLSVKCAAQSALITGVVVLDLCGIGEGAVLDAWRLVFSVLIATALIWFATGVIGPALAETPRHHDHHARSHGEDHGVRKERVPEVDHARTPPPFAPLRPRRPRCPRRSVRRLRTSGRSEHPWSSRRPSIGRAEGSSFGHPRFRSHIARRDDRFVPRA